MANIDIVKETHRSTLPDECCCTCKHFVRQAWADCGHGCEFIERGDEPRAYESDVCDGWELR